MLLLTKLDRVRWRVWSPWDCSSVLGKVWRVATAQEQERGAAMAGKDLLGAREASTHSLQCLQDVVWLCGPFLSLGPTWVKNARRIKLGEGRNKRGVNAARKWFIFWDVNTWLPNSSHFPSLFRDTLKLPFVYCIQIFYVSWALEEILSTVVRGFRQFSPLYSKSSSYTEARWSWLEHILFVGKGIAKLK